MPPLFMQCAAFVKERARTFRCQIDNYSFFPMMNIETNPHLV